MKKKKLFKPQKLFNIAITYLIILAVCFVFLFPILWLVLASFSKTGSIYSFKGSVTLSSSSSTVTGIP